MATARKEMVTPSQEPKNASDLFIKALENEGVEVIYGVPGEENLDFLEALRKPSIKLILTRHEQGAGFMAARRVKKLIRNVSLNCTADYSPQALPNSAR